MSFAFHRDELRDHPLRQEPAKAGLKTTKTVAPPKRSKGIVVKTTDELIAALKGKGLL